MESFFENKVKASQGNLRIDDVKRLFMSLGSTSFRVPKKYKVKIQKEFFITTVGFRRLLLKIKAREDVDELEEFFAENFTPRLLKFIISPFRRFKT